MAVGNKSVTSRLENKKTELSASVQAEKNSAEYPRAEAKAAEVAADIAAKQSAAVAEALAILDAAGVRV